MEYQNSWSFGSRAARRSDADTWKVPLRSLQRPERLRWDSGQRLLPKYIQLPNHFLYRLPIILIQGLKLGTHKTNGFDSQWYGLPHYLPPILPNTTTPSKVPQYQRGAVQRGRGWETRDKGMTLPNFSASAVNSEPKEQSCRWKLRTGVPANERAEKRAQNKSQSPEVQ